MKKQKKEHSKFGITILKELNDKLLMLSKKKKMSRNKLINLLLTSILKGE